MKLHFLRLGGVFADRAVAQLVERPQLEVAELGVVGQLENVLVAVLDLAVGAIPALAVERQTQPARFTEIPAEIGAEVLDRVRVRNRDPSDLLPNRVVADVARELDPRRAVVVVVIAHLEAQGEGIAELAVRRAVEAQDVDLDVGLRGRQGSRVGGGEGRVVEVDAANRRVEGVRQELVVLLHLVVAQRPAHVPRTGAVAAVDEQGAGLVVGREVRLAGRRTAHRPRPRRRVGRAVGRVGDAPRVVEDQRVDVVLERRVAVAESEAALLALELTRQRGVVGRVVDRLRQLDGVAESEGSSVRPVAGTVLVAVVELPGHLTHLPDVEHRPGAVALQAEVDGVGGVEVGGDQTVQVAVVDARPVGRELLRQGVLQRLLDGIGDLPAPRRGFGEQIETVVAEVVRDLVVVDHHRPTAGDTVVERVAGVAAPDPLALEFEEAAVLALARDLHLGNREPARPVPVLVELRGVGADVDVVDRDIEPVHLESEAGVLGRKCGSGQEQDAGECHAKWNVGAHVVSPNNRGTETKDGCCHG